MSDTLRAPQKTPAAEACIPAIYLPEGTDLSDSSKLSNACFAASSKGTGEFNKEQERPSSWIDLSAENQIRDTDRWVGMRTDFAMILEHHDGMLRLHSKAGSVDLHYHHQTQLGLWDPALPQLARAVTETEPDHALGNGSLVYKRGEEAPLRLQIVRQFNKLLDRQKGDLPAASKCLEMAESGQQSHLLVIMLWLGSVHAAVRERVSPESDTLIE